MIPMPTFAPPRPAPSSGLHAHETTQATTPMQMTPTQAVPRNKGGVLRRLGTTLSLGLALWPVSSCLSQPIVTPPKIQTPSVESAKTIRMWVPTQPGVNYTVESKPQLQSALAWAPLTSFIGSGSAVPVTDLSSGASSFYRVSADPAPQIQTHPKSQTVAAGAVLQLSVSASGMPSLGYEWYGPGGLLRDGALIAGSASASLTLTSAAVADAGNYWVVVSNDFGRSTSSIAGIRIAADLSPRILADPQTQDLLSGQPLNLSVLAVGQGALSFAWFGPSGLLSDDGRVSGSTSANLNLSRVDEADAGDYFAVVANTLGRATSAVASVRVTLGQAPRILLSPENQSVSVGQPLTLTISASGAEPLGFQWYGPSGMLTDGDRVQGATTASLTIADLQVDDNGEYYVAVSNAFGSIQSVPVQVRVRQPSDAANAGFGGDKRCY
jgi:hypothetical protein